MSIFSSSSISCRNWSPNYSVLVDHTKAAFSEYARKVHLEFKKIAEKKNPKKDCLVALAAESSFQHFSTLDVESI
jgi:hypothetical protein